MPEWAKPPAATATSASAARAAAAARAAGQPTAKRERLQKVMAQSGHGSRRNIEILIAQGHITINGQVAKLGDSVGPGDKVKLDGNVINLRFGEPLPRVLIYHKPEGEIVTPRRPGEARHGVRQAAQGEWRALGLRGPAGLQHRRACCIFTTNGELANRLTHPRFEVEREYAVRMLGELTDEQKAKLLERRRHRRRASASSTRSRTAAARAPTTGTTWCCAKERTARCAA